MTSSAKKAVSMYTSSNFEHAVKKLCLPAAPRQAVSPYAGLPRGIESLPETRVWAPQAQQQSLDDLGEDLLLHILRLAQPTAWDLCRMACVSRVWKRLCYSRIFWTKLRISSGSMRPGVEALAARCSNVMELHIDDPRCELFVLHPIVMACGDSLQRVVVNCDKDTTGRNEAAICSILWIVSLHCKRVETVELMSDGARGGFQYLENKALWYLTSGFRNIRSFACLCQEAITRQSLYLMVIAWRDLACLRIHCGLLLRDDLVCLRKCHALVVLELVGGNLAKIIDGGVPEAPEQQQQVAHPWPGWGTGCVDMIHAELEVLILTNTKCSAHQLATLVAGFPGLQRVLVSKSSWALGTPAEVVQQRRHLATLQRWLALDKGICLMVED